MKKELKDYLKSKHEEQLNIVLKILPKEFQDQYKIDFYETIEFRKELIKESDRGLALLAVGKIDVKLREYLEHCLIGSSTHFRDIFNSNGPLSTFSARIKLAYSMGLLTKKLSIEINALREIRNMFAHHDKAISFTSTEINKICKKLSFIPKKQENRKVFITTTMLILSTIMALLRKSKPFTEMEEIYSNETLYKMAISVEQSKEIVNKELESTYK